MAIAITIGILVSLGTIFLVLVRFLPAEVEYIELVEVAAPVNRVYDAIRFQEQLMEWSAWPRETDSLCEVAHVDGKVGAQTVFMNRKGKRFGYQEITGLQANERVSFFLKSHVAPFEKDVRLEFRLKPIPDDRTEVMLWFREKLRKPHFLIAYFGGILGWVREMHRKDLAGLKEFVE
ncbi:MAG: SRPBCC domain-containing protein [Bacteroidota bacterium]